MSSKKEEKLVWLAAMGLDTDKIPQPRDDWRHIDKGMEIPTQSYADQPYVVRTDDGAWLCVMTTGVKCEGQKGQHVITVRSTDQGKSWSQPIALEPSDGVEASYAVLLKAPGGRIYCFYNHNTDDIREVKCDEGTFVNGMCQRVDSLGYFVFKYSDDHGKSWSKKRYNIDVREMEIDRKNVYGGKIRFFWNVGKPFIHNGAAFVSLHKCGGFGEGFFTSNEGVLLKSDNLLTETDPEKINWQTLPDGEIGLRTPPGGGPISSEQSYSVMSDGSFFVVYRCKDGHPVCSYSRDGGHNWSAPEYMPYTPGGKKIKHPRAANFAWKCSNGRYLYWFHNHGGKNYEDRNPVWMLCGREISTPEGLKIEWSQPEIVLYHDDFMIRMSYPDMIEQDGKFYLTETEKSIARTHIINDKFLDILFRFDSVKESIKEGLIFSRTGDAVSGKCDLPQLPQLLVRDMFDPSYKTLDLRTGITLDIWFSADRLIPGQILLDNRDKDNIGFCVSVAEKGTLELKLHDGRTTCCWLSDENAVQAGKQHHVGIVIDGGPKIISFIIDGQFCDGGNQRQFGWGRYSPNLKTLSGSESISIAPDFSGKINSVKIYDRALMSTEIVSNYRAGI
jgi:hypothetical protein